MNNNTIKIQWKQVITLLILFLIILTILMWFLSTRIFPVSWDFRNNLWGPSYLLLQQRSPYNIHVIFDGSNAIWLPVIIGLFFPIGFLPSQWASNLWLILNLLSMFLMVILLARSFQKSGVWIPLIIFSLALFPSSMTHLVLGQVSFIICLVLVLLSKIHNQHKPALIGLLLAISYTKPQLIILFLPAYFFIYFHEHGIKKLLKVILYNILWVLLLCLPLFFLYPNWIPDFFYNISINNTWFYPTLYSYLLSNFGSFGIAIMLAGIYLFLGICIAIYCSIKLDSFEALLWSLAITPIFSPVIWSWDFVLIYPLIVFMVFDKKPLLSSWVIYGSYFICTIGFIVMKVNGLVDDQMTFWVPPLLVTALVISRILKNNSKTDKPIVI